MKTSRFYISLLLCLSYVTSAEASEADPRVQADKVAEREREHFRETAAHWRSASDFGLRDMGDLRRARLEGALPVYEIDFGRLLTDRSSIQNPVNLLEDDHMFIYPISIGGVIVNAVWVQRRPDGQYHVTEIDGGIGDVTQTLAIVKKLGLDPKIDDVRYIDIFALHAELIGPNLAQAEISAK